MGSARRQFDPVGSVCKRRLDKPDRCLKLSGAKAATVAAKAARSRRSTERVSPRVFRVVALPTPTEREKSQIYLQRYVGHLPAAGEVVIFDRSWYNRAGVERVMGFAKQAEVEKFLKAAPLVEKAIVDSGVILLKYWLEVSPDEQTRRIADRIDDGRELRRLQQARLR